MFSTDAHFLLALHRDHADELRAEADSARLARSVSRGSRRNRTRAAWGRRHDSAASGVRAAK
ncbi:hypothetical protein GCM10022225_32000 [Plantactinospora mayteni]|uniref:Uncharacterized protein n=1 Tax=Plantactinospora mayteni TaxID=566021 RepID=A0ABQ4ELP0_9ACTN|nr:hypothetical protein [Plantactinospora mayteni]GIG95636.1 hypothetical protein Pma05_22090 [Plantactinospora mayteni]